MDVRGYQDVIRQINQQRQPSKLGKGNDGAGVAN